jgi:hypothetical protein
VSGQRREDVRSHQDLDGEADGEVADQGERHRGQRAFDERAGEHAQRDGEERVADQRRTLEVEEEVVEPGPSGAQQRIRPPREQQREARGEPGDREYQQSDLDRGPAQPGDALGPDHPVLAVLDLASHQRHTPEDARQQGKDDRDHPGVADRQEPLAERAGEKLAPVRPGDAEAVGQPEVLVHATHVEPR